MSVIQGITTEARTRANTQDISIIPKQSLLSISALIPNTDLLFWRVLVGSQPHLEQYPEQHAFGCTKRTDSCSLFFVDCIRLWRLRTEDQRAPLSTTPPKLLGTSYMQGRLLGWAPHLQGTVPAISAILHPLCTENSPPHPPIEQGSTQWSHAG